jgi:hypothetical protein
MLLTLLNNKGDLIGQLARNLGNTGELGIFHPSDGHGGAQIHEMTRHARIEQLVSLSTWVAAAIIGLTALYLGYRALTLV